MEFHVGVLVDVDLEDKGFDVRRAAVAVAVLVVRGGNERELLDVPTALLPTWLLNLAPPNSSTKF